MPTQSIDPELANPLKSTQNDIFESPTLERLPIAAIDYLRDPRMRFRTIISLISLLSQTLLIGSAGQHRMPLLSRKTPSRRKQNQLRILGALATVLVRRDEAAAAAGSLERVFVAYNPASPKSDRLKVGPAHTYTPRPDDLSLNAVTAYLVSTRAGQTFDDHAKFIMQFANQFCSDPSPGTAAAGLVRSFITYVVGSSAPKMFLRLNHPKYSKPYFDAIVHLPTSELVWVTKWASPPNLADFSFIRILHGVHGVKFLRRVQQNIAQPPADPHWARVISELPRCRTDDPDGYKLLFPGLWGLAGQLDAIYTESTYREFHQMLCLALIGYRASLNTLVGLSNPTQEDLLEAIDVVCNYLLILRPIADSAAFIDHSSTITNANGLRRCRGSPYVAQEPSELEEYTEGPGAELFEDSADMDVTDTYGEERPSMDTPHARWIKLQMAYITAVGFIVDLSRLGAHLPGPIELVIHTIPPARGIMAPLMPVIENIMNRYGLCLHAEGPDGNVLTDMEIIKTAFEDLRECTDPSLGRSLDLMCQGEFSGQVHCEAALAALMFDPASGFQTRDKEVMGVSRRCCPVCSAVLDALPFYEGRPIDVLGHHTAAIPCALPDNLPPSAINFVLGCFEREFVLSLHGLCVLSKRSRAKSKSGFGYEARNDVLRQRVAYAQGKLA